jgi:uncharacterized membrane protein YedE/YeeE
MNSEIIVNASLGGALIGLSAVFLMLTLGRISGISGITSGLLSLNLTKNDLWRGAFLLGLLLGPLVYLAMGGKAPELKIESNFAYLVVGGLLVGFGASMGSGCTSGHGVCGIARISPRSLVATAVFLSTAIITVFLSR